MDIEHEVMLTQISAKAGVKEVSSSAESDTRWRRQILQFAYGTTRGSINPQLDP